MKLVICTGIALVAIASAEDLKPVAIKPLGTTDTRILVLEAQNESLKADVAQLIQELELWQNLQVMRVRLRQAEAKQKLRELEAEEAKRKAALEKPKSQ